MSNLAGKTALVTGASGGIGQSIAARLAADGANVALIGQSVERLQLAADRATAVGRTARCYTCDVSKGDAVQATVSQVAMDFGGLDILVNNAGITRDGLVVRMSEADWDQVMTVNLKSVFLFTKAVSKIMMKNRAGAIVNISSIIGLIGNAGQGNYSASKAGIIAFTKSVAKELASRNVRANAIAPGFIETKMTAEMPEDLQKKMLESIPLGRYGKPEDVASVVSFLASDDAAYVTGQVLTVCGGLVM
ncbi:MAG TPA: 3-oxoacyl-[acyl-carrier-protein] reductase [Kiritimatiellia bacterium]